MADVGVAQLSCGDYHSAALSLDGRLWLWGRGSEGQLGPQTSGATEDISTPTQHATLSTCKAISCGWGHCAVLSDTEVAAVGPMDGAGAEQQDNVEADSSSNIDEVLSQTGRDYGNFLRFPGVCECECGCVVSVECCR